MTGSSSAANVERQATSNGDIWQTGNTNATPVMIAFFTNRVDVSAGRSIISLSYNPITLNIIKHLVFVCV